MYLPSDVSAYVCMTHYIETPPVGKGGVCYVKETTGNKTALIVENILSSLLKLLLVMFHTLRGFNLKCGEYDTDIHNVNVKWFKM